MKKIMLLLASLVLVGCGSSYEPLYFARLSGQEQVPPWVTDIVGNFTLDTNLGTYTLVVRLLPEPDGDYPTLTVAHLHCAKFSANGPVVYNLVAESEGWIYQPESMSYTKLGRLIESRVVPSEGNSACSFDITDLATVKEAMDAGEIYVNVHSVEMPSGEIRGQVFQNEAFLRDNSGAGGVDGDIDSTVEELTDN